MKELDEIFQIASKPMFEGTKHGCFFTQDEYEARRGVITILTGNIRSIENKFSKLNPERLG